MTKVTMLSRIAIYRKVKHVVTEHFLVKHQHIKLCKKNLMLIIVSTQLLFSNSLMIIISIIPVLLMVWIILIGSV